MISESFTTGQVAKALEVPVRRLEGWAEQGLLCPKVQRGRSRHGDRRHYAWPDVMMAAVLAEVQKLLGNHFRPGGLVVPISAIGSKSYGLLGDVRTTGATLVVGVIDGKPTAQIFYKPAINHLPTGSLVVNIDRLAHQVKEALKRG